MIGYLKGEILDSEEGRLVVLARGSGVGYAVSVPTSADYVEYLQGKEVELFIHTHVREDALELFGFATRMEKDLFLTLLSVNGIGPKSAMGVLSAAGSDTLLSAIIDGDKNSLTKLPGVGKKTAERVVMELGDKVRKKVETGVWPMPGARPAKSVVGSGARAAGPALPAQGGSVYLDAKIALVGLGYREADVNTLLQKLIHDSSESGTPIARAEDLVKVALRQLA